MSESGARAKGPDPETSGGTGASDLPTSATPVAPALAGGLEVGEQVGEYIIEEVLGQGGMGTVYRAHHRLLGVQRALKVVKRDLVAEPAARERFLREARILAQLEHPNLVRVYECAPIPSGGYYLAQEFLGGESLRDRVDAKGRLEAGEATRLIADAARGLGAAHAKGVVHRDVSADNLMVAKDTDGRECLKVIDFGIARTAIGTADGGTLTREGVFVGKLEYCSPEQAGKLEPGEVVDGRSDIYSLGVVLYRILTGRLPFNASTPVGYLRNHLMTPPPLPASFGVEVPPRLESLLMEMLAKNREDRPQTMEEVVRRLADSVTPLPGTVVLRISGEAELRGATAPRSRRHWVAPGLLLVGVLAANTIETTIETWLRTRFHVGTETGAAIAATLHSLEHSLSFESHDATGLLGVYGYSIAYFLFFPILGIATAVALARRANPAPLRVFASAVFLDYLISLPFFIFFPVPERWASPDSEAVLLSDLWSSKLIEAARPMSGLDNCFPSFHASMTVILIGIAFAYKLRWRRTSLALGCLIILSTFVLGIHWIADIGSGVALGILSIALARHAVHRIFPLSSPAY